MFAAINKLYPLSTASLHKLRNNHNGQPQRGAAVTPLLAQEGGEKLAVGLLPAYVCRRPAERELVKDVISETTKLEEAFEILISNLDPPIDPQQSMVDLCHKEWEVGVLVDDYYTF